MFVLLTGLCKHPRRWFEAVDFGLRQLLERVGMVACAAVDIRNARISPGRGFRDQALNDSQVTFADVIVELADFVVVEGFHNRVD